MFFDFFKKKKDVSTIEEVNLELLKDFDFDSVTDNTIIEGNINSDKTLLIMDDVMLSKVLIESDFNEINKNYGLDVYDKFKIMWVIGPSCGILSYKKILIDKVDVTHAMFDITIGEVVKVKEINILLSGVNILTHILKYKNTNFRFITAHTMNEENSYINSIIKSFNGEFKDDIDKFVIKKNSLDRVDKIYDFLK